MLALAAGPLQSTQVPQDIEGAGDLGQAGVIVRLMSVHEGGLERRDIYGVADRQVHGGVDHVSEGWFVVLDGASLTVAVVQEDELVLLTGPQGTYTFSVQL